MSEDSAFANAGRNLSALEEPDPQRCLAVLASIEKTTRRCLHLDDESSPTWFSDIGLALMKSQSTIGAELRVEILLLVIQWLFKEGRSEEGLALGRRALQLASDAKALALQRKAWSHLGFLNIGIHSLTEASICFVNALQIADQIGDRIGKCAAVANLAAARLEAGLIDESITLNEYVIDLAEGEPHLETLRTEAHHNIALASLLLADLDTAKGHMELAIRLLHEPNSQFDAHSRVAMELTFTKILVRIGNLAEAKERSKLAGEYAKKLNSRPARIQSELAKALLNAAEGKSDIALTRLAQVEREVRMSDPGFRDFLEVELICNQYAGRERFSKYYKKKHLSSLAEFQRSIANRQIGSLKKAVTARHQTASIDTAFLPTEFREHVQNVHDVHMQLEALAVLTELREEAAGGHSLRVGRLASRLSLSIGFREEQAAALDLAARLHDIGKLATPDAILLKHQKLSATEVEIIRRHTTEGCQMLTEILISLEQTSGKSRSSDLALLRLAAEIALHHHEWWDGSGYPRKIAGQAIPQAARITTVADVFDELTHARPYKKAMSPERALERMQILAGRQFDPDLFLAFAKLVRASSDPHHLISPPPREQILPFVGANRIIDRIVRASRTTLRPLPTSN